MVFYKTERDGNMEINYNKRVPKAIKERTIENIEVYHLSLGDSFEEAVRELAKKGTELWNAWYYSDYRKFLPQIYHEEYLDFNKYPLKY
jgi:hypothetical protein